MKHVFSHILIEKKMCWIWFRNSDMEDFIRQYYWYHEVFTVGSGHNWGKLAPCLGWNSGQTSTRRDSGETGLLMRGQRSEMERDRKIIFTVLQRLSQHWWKKMDQQWWRCRRHKLLKRIFHKALFNCRSGKEWWNFSEFSERQQDRLRKSTDWKNESPLDEVQVLGTVLTCSKIISQQE